MPPYLSTKHNITSTALVCWHTDLITLTIDDWTRLREQVDLVDFYRISSLSNICIFRLKCDLLEKHTNSDHVIASMF